MHPSTLLTRWNALARPARLVLTLVASGALLISIAAGIATHPARTALFAAPLHPEQLDEVQARLAGWNVAFTPTADNVMVDSSRRNALLLRLSLAGVPHAHVDTTPEVLSKLGALTPQSVIDAQTSSALAGDIESALRTISGVQDARVIVASAKPGYFADQPSRDATAGVRLQLVPGASLAPEAVAGIRAYVAASVPGLDSKRVAIVDDRGVALTDGSSGDDDSLARSLQSALDATLGAGAALVRVRVERDRRDVTSTEIRRAPVSALPIGASTQDERYADGGKRYGRTQSQLDRGSDTRETQASASPGTVSRISAAVFVDAARGIDLDRVRRLSAATLGIDARRGDVLAVTAMTFARSAPSPRSSGWLAYGAFVAVAPALAFAFAGLFALRSVARPAFGLLAAAGRRARIAQTTASVRDASAAHVRGALRDEPPHAAAAVISALPAATAAAVLDLYPPEERAVIVRRMQRPYHSPLLDDVHEWIADA